MHAGASGAAALHRTCLVGGVSVVSSLRPEFLKTGGRKVVEERAQSGAEGILAGDVALNRPGHGRACRRRLDCNVHCYCTVLDAEGILGPLLHPTYRVPLNVMVHAIAHVVLSRWSIDCLDDLVSVGKRELSGPTRIDGAVRRADGLNTVNKEAVGSQRPLCRAALGSVCHLDPPARLEGPLCGHHCPNRLLECDVHRLHRGGLPDSIGNAVGVAGVARGTGPWIFPRCWLHRNGGRDLRRRYSGASVGGDDSCLGRRIFLLLPHWLYLLLRVDYGCARRLGAGHVVPPTVRLGGGIEVVRWIIEH
mmetsp:Transcript_10418/g.26735  ORF Transcript_10418/g.26735 Transcript_10418/m.26735 type:complete len:306 (+) Transcript_10418:78-995(+)